MQVCWWVHPADHDEALLRLFLTNCKDLLGMHLGSGESVDNEISASVSLITMHSSLPCALGTAKVSGG